jgi:LmbE family N-acetylglucosaminyl deacetylase
MRLLCVSVHSDDAAFSVASALKAARADERVILTLMSRSLWAWGRRGASETRSLRKREDREFARWAGAIPQWFGLPDCSLAGPPTAERRAVVEQALDEILESPSARDGVVWLPLGVAKHPDHQLVGQAVLRRAASGALPTRCWLYEDLPYAVHHPPEQGARLLRKHRVAHETLKLRRADEDGRAVLAAYRSQVNREIERDLSGAVERLHAIGTGDCSLERILPVGGSHG